MQPMSKALVDKLVAGCQPQRWLRIAEKDQTRNPTLFEESISSDEVKAARRQVQPLIDRIRNALKAE